MSYSCTISFKTINADEIYPFFQQIKKACIDNIESLRKKTTHSAHRSSVAHGNP